MTAELYTVDIPGAAWCYLEGTGAAQQWNDPEVARHENPAWVRLGQALNSATSVKRGFGEAYRVTGDIEVMHELYDYLSNDLDIYDGGDKSSEERTERAACIRAMQRMAKMLGARMTWDADWRARA